MRPPATAPGPDRRFADGAKLLVGFILGALCGLVPMYYYLGREAGLRAAGHSQGEALSPGEAAGRSPLEPAGARSPSKSFASQLTYELSRPPDEPAAAPAKAAAVRAPAAASESPPTPAVASAPSTNTVAPPATPPAAERVANARPISSVPPEPRDRTTEIEREAHKAEYREAPRQAKAPPPPPRVFEGRAVELKPPRVASDAPGGRHVAPVESASPRAEGEAERVAGVSPIKPAPKAPAPTIAATAPTAAEPSAAAAGQIESRLEATREWLAASPATTHTIQLLGASSEEQLRAHLKSLAKLVEPGKIYVFRTKAQGKPSITVVYGAYADRQSALQALEKLPSALAANKPVLRTVNGIRAEMKQNNTDG